MRSPARVIGSVLGLALLIIVVVLAGRSGLLGPTEPQADPSSVSSLRPAPSASSRAPSRSPAPSRPPSAAPSRDPESGLPFVAYAALPVQARRTITLIEAGGPFPYAKDGAVFGNRERLLPAQRSGFYREYTVPTPGEGDRGARRIVTGDQDRTFFYTDDHYLSFRRVAR